MKRQGSCKIHYNMVLMKEYWKKTSKMLISCIY